MAFELKLSSFLQKLSEHILSTLCAAILKIPFLKDNVFKCPLKRMNSAAQSYCRSLLACSALAYIVCCEERATYATE